MRTKQLIKSILSVALCLTVGCSTAITVFADSVGASIGGASGSSGYADGWMLPNSYAGVIRLTASKINHTSAIDNMTNITTRYGDMYAYPLYMFTRGSFGRDKTTTFYSNSIERNIEQLKNEPNIDTTTIKYTNEYNITADYSNNTDDLMVHDKVVYLEKCLDNLKNNSTYSDLDKVCFWYLYTTLAKGVNTDTYPSFGGKGTSELGDKLDDAITKHTDNTALTKEVHQLMLQHGYVVALHLAYGNKALKQLAKNSEITFSQNLCPIEFKDGAFKKKDNVNNLSAAWGRHTSFVVDRMFGTYYDKGGYNLSFLCTAAEYLKMAYVYGIKGKISDNLVNTNFLREGEFIHNYYGTYMGYQIGRYLGITDKSATVLSSWQLSSVWGDWNNLAGFAKFIYSIRPVQPGLGTVNSAQEMPVLNSNGALVDSTLENNEKQFIFGGWGFYPFDDIPEVPEAPDTAAFVGENNKYIGMEVTYNAYINGENETNDFGTNGHVMTDTVLLTKPVNWKDYVKDTDDNLTGSQKPKYFKTQLDKSIKLDTPFKDTTFNYANSYYKITSPLGDTSYLTTTRDGKEVDNIGVNLKDKNYLFDIPLTDVTTAFTNAEEANKITSFKNVDSAADVFTESNKCGWYSLTGKDGQPYLLELFADEECTNPVQRAADGTKFDEHIVFDRNNNQVHPFGEDSANKVYKWFDYYILKNNSINKAYMKFADKNKVLQKYEVKITNGIVSVVRKIEDQSLLIKLQVNYVANKDSAYNNKFQTADMKSYMLSQNNITSDFIKDGNTPYTMIDNYVTDIWGNLTGQNRKVRTNTNSEPTTPIVQGNAKILFNTGIIAYNGGGVNTASISSSDKLGESYIPETYYITALRKTIPTFGTNKYFNSIKGSSAFSIFTTGVLSNIAKNYSLNTNGENISNPKIAKTNNNNVFKAEIDVEAVNTEPNKSLTIYYSQSNFNKVLANYELATYIKRSSLPANLQPTLANWISTSGSAEYEKGIKGGTISSNDNYTSANMFVRFGSVRKSSTVSDSDGNFKNIEGSLTTDGIQKGVTPVVTSRSALGFEKKSISNQEQGNINVATPYTQSSYDVKLGYKINGLEVGITLPENIPSVPTSINTTNGSISRSWQYHLPGNPTSDDGYIDGGKNLFLKVVPEVDMFGENQWVDSQRKLVASGGLPTGQDRPQNTSYYSVTTAGQQYRYVPAMTYSTISFNTSNEVKSQVTGTAVAFDTRAKNLATRLGGTNVPVLYSGSGLNIAYNSSAGGTIKAYAIDINGTTVNDANGNLTTIKSEWGNGNYSAKTAAQKSMQGLAEQFNVTTSNKMVIYDSETDTIKDYDLTNPTTGNLSIGNVTNGFVYALKVRGGYVQAVTAKYNNANVANYDVSVSGNNITVTKGTLANTVTTVEQPSANTIKAMLINMKLVGNDSILLQAFDKGKAGYAVTVPNGNDKITESGLLTYLGTVDKYKVNGETRYKANSDWYFEDTSVLVVREYTANLTASTKATDTEQIPINMGPATPKNKNNYFSNGYKGWIVSSVEIRGKADTDVANRVIVSKSSTHDKVDGSGKVSVWVNGNINASKANAAIAKPDFIISDVTINEATGF